MQLKFYILEIQIFIFNYMWLSISQMFENLQFVIFKGEWTYGVLRAPVRVFSGGETGGTITTFSLSIKALSHQKKISRNQ